METIQLRNSYVKKIFKSIDSLGNKITLLNNIDNVILSNQIGGSTESVPCPGNDTIEKHKTHIVDSINKNLEIFTELEKKIISLVDQLKLKGSSESEKDKLIERLQQQLSDCNKCKGEYEAKLQQFTDDLNKYDVHNTSVGEKSKIIIDQITSQINPIL